MKKVLMLAALGMLVVLSSCGSLLDTPTGSVKLQNNTTQNVVTAFYIASGSDWGVNQLGANLDTNANITITNITPGDYNFKVSVSNTFYYEVEVKASTNNQTNTLTSYNTSTGTVVALETLTLTLEPAWLTVSNNSSSSLYYLYLNETGSFDLLNMVETNIATGDIIAANGAHAFGEELVAGTYNIIAISDSSVTNTYSNVTLSANTTNILNITNF